MEPLQKSKHRSLRQLWTSLLQWELMEAAIFDWVHNFSNITAKQMSGSATILEENYTLICCGDDENNANKHYNSTEIWTFV